MCYAIHVQHTRSLARVLNSTHTCAHWHSLHVVLYKSKEFLWCSDGPTVLVHLLNVCEKMLQTQQQTVGGHAHWLCSGLERRRKPSEVSEQDFIT